MVDNKIIYSILNTKMIISRAFKFVPSIPNNIKGADIIEIPVIIDNKNVESLYLESNFFVKYTNDSYPSSSIYFIKIK